ncbi:MAG: transporter permease, partial [Frankiales bacterium]|nr:transporter permease [Frankiales bacterium]
MTAVLDAPVVVLPARPSTARARRRLPAALPRAVSPLVLLGLWQVLSGTRLLPAERLAPPSAVVAAARELWASGALQDAV